LGKALKFSYSVPKNSIIIKIAFSDCCRIDIMYEGKCPFFKIIDKILGINNPSKEQTKK
jgi:hypothetical protein